MKTNLSSDNNETQSGATSSPDWGSLREIAFEIETAIKDGSWNKDKFDDVLERAEEAAGGDPEFYEFVLNYAEDDWVNHDDTDDGDESSNDSA